MDKQQRPWTSRLAEARGDWPSPYEEPDFAPDPTDPKLLDEIRAAWAMEIASEFWDLEDEDLELDDCGNPIVDHSQRAWAKRLEHVSSNGSSDTTVQAVLRQPFPSVLLGAALCAGQPYLLWNIQTFLSTLLTDDEAWMRRSCGVLLRKLCAANGAVVQDYITADVLFPLLVEPFALMNQLRK